MFKTILIRDLQKLPAALQKILPLFHPKCPTRSSLQILASLNWVAFATFLCSLSGAIFLFIKLSPASWLGPRSCELTLGQSDGLAQWQLVSIGSDGVRLPIFSNTRNLKFAV